MYYQFKNGGHVVYLILNKSASTDLAWHNETITITVFWQNDQKLLAEMSTFGISWPIGGAVSNYDMYPKIMFLMKCTRLHHVLSLGCVSQKQMWMQVPSIPIEPNGALGNAPQIQPLNQFWLDNITFAKHHNIWTKMNMEILLFDDVQLVPKFIWANFSKNWEYFEWIFVKKNVYYSHYCNGGVLMWDYGS